jgi:autotransporter adhesin
MAGSDGTAVVASTRDKTNDLQDGQLGVIGADGAAASVAAHIADTTSAHVVAGLANAFSALKTFASGDVNKAHGNGVTVTGIAVGDQIVSVIKDSTPNLSHVAITDAVISADTVTFTATDFGANDGVVILYLDLT